MYNIFEIHVTTTVNNEKELDTFKNICINFKSLKCPFIQSCKPIIIKLDRGQHSFQPMCAISVYSKIDIVFNIMKLFSRTLIENGLVVCREKIELKLFTKNNSIPDECNKEYFEFHCGIHIFDTRSEFKIKNAHLSKSILADKADNYRVVTFRNKNLESISDFFSQVDNFISELKLWDGCMEVKKKEYELCVYDNFEGLDEGWLNK